MKLVLFKIKFTYLLNQKYNEEAIFFRNLYI